MPDGFGAMHDRGEVHDVFMQRPDIADAASTREWLLRGAKRKTETAPIRTAFVQIRGTSGESIPGPLAGLVRAHDGLALDLYLLLMALASAPPYDVTKNAKYWARALGLVDERGTHNTTTISKAWGRLERSQLISRERKNGLASITPLREDGSGKPYKPPSGSGSKRELYFRIPYAYWIGENPPHESLLPREKAMLLIALSRLTNEFTLTAENVAKWYGVSVDTAQKGFKGLVDKGVLKVDYRRRRAPDAPDGWTNETFYHLQSPFKINRQPKRSTGAKAKSSPRTVKGRSSRQTEVAKSTTSSRTVNKQRKT